MVIGIDGFIEQRIEQLYVCDEYKLFFLTGQPNNTGRRAFITAKPFHAIDDEALPRMKAQAIPWTEKDSRVQISAGMGILAFHDTITGTVSNMQWSELDIDVQENLRRGGGQPSSPNPWAKYAGPSIRTGGDVTVGGPLKLKKPGTFNL